jgi:imidazolonepropionase-like amidohydrolase
MKISTPRLRVVAAIVVLGSALGIRPLAARAQTPRQTAAQLVPQVVIRGGWLFTGIADARVRNTGIVVANGKFAEVGANLSGRDLSKARVIDLDDNATILPGLFDLHAHYNVRLFAGGRVDEFTYNPLIFLANGVTSTWPAGEFDPEGMMEARKRIDSGKQVGSRLFNSGPYFGRARCADANNHTSECSAWPNNITEQQIRDQVDYWSDRGARGVKIKLATPNEMRIVIDQAHKHGLTASSHMQSEDFHQDIDTRDAILMGLDRVEHSIAPVEDVMYGKYPAGSLEMKALIDLMLARNVYYDATMRAYGGGTIATSTTLKTHWIDEAKFWTPYMRSLFQKRSDAPRQPQQPPAGSLRDFAKLFRHKVPEVKAFYDAGGGRLITVGTDMPTSGPELAGFAYHRELQAIVYAGLPPLAALKAATINGARALGLGDRLGSIEPGKLADLYVANGNPLERIEDARQVQLIMKSGEIYDPLTLLKSAEGKIGPSGEGDRAAWTVTKVY